MRNKLRIVLITTTTKRERDTSNADEAHRTKIKLGKNGKTKP